MLEMIRKLFAKKSEARYSIETVLADAGKILDSRRKQAVEFLGDRYVFATPMKKPRKRKRVLQ